MNSHNGYLGCRALWSFSRHQTVRALWKMVAVPGMTFATAVLCVSAREHLEVKQREVGRIALGTHGSTARDNVPGDMRWSFFKAREATSKRIYERLLCTLPERPWVRQLRAKFMVGLDTTCVLRSMEDETEMHTV